MLGVLLAVDSAGKTHTLKAFSGQLNNQWVVHGWAPPLWTLRHDTEDGIYAEAMQRITDLGQQAHDAQAVLDATPRTPDTRTTVADAEQRRVHARRAQRAASAELLARIRSSMVVRNFRGQTASLQEASLLGDASPGGTGDCCAPKLLNAAYAAHLRPVSITEVWFGSPPPSGGRVEGETYAACAERCQPLLGYMLCGL
jgi:hypothetical protein